MTRTHRLLDHRGMPVDHGLLRKEIAAPVVGGVRSPISGYPADGLTPPKLAAILREADMGDPLRYLELAEQIEERDPHYAGVLGTRKRAVSQLEITVEDASDDPRDGEMAQMIRDWLTRDELTEELFDILDALGKGYSHTEIVWDTSSLQWWPEKLERRDPRWFRFANHDLATPRMIDQAGQEVDYPAFKFIYAQMKAKSGLPLRSGLARLATWNWMFKAYTQRDWAIFTQTYGQPIRVGKYGAGADEKDRNTLFRAVANIGGDCAAIIPESMMIEFVEAKNVGASTDHYEKRADWLDKQISKAVLGQTSTTDAEVGGLGSGKEHREVQKDIETADAKALAAILNRDLVRPWIDLEYGPQARYPRIRISRPEDEDLKAFAEAVGPLVDRGLRVPMSAVMKKFSLPEPRGDEEILRPQARSGPDLQREPGAGDATGPESAVKYRFNTPQPSARPETALQAEGPSAARSAALAETVDLLAEEAAPEMARMLGRIEVMLAAAGSLEEFRTMLLEAYPKLDGSAMAEMLGRAMQASMLRGIADIEAEG